jgi:laccase
MAVLRQSMVTGAPPNVSDTILINGQPGDFLPCSSQGERRFGCLVREID